MITSILQQPYATNGITLLTINSLQPFVNLPREVHKMFLNVECISFFKAGKSEKKGESRNKAKLYILYSISRIACEKRCSNQLY